MDRRQFARVGVTGLLWPPSMAAAEPPESPLAKQLVQKSKEFERKVATAKADVDRKFTARVGEIRRDTRLLPAARADKLDQWKKAQGEFKASGRFLADDEFAGMELEYSLAVNKAFLPLAKQAEEEIDKGLKADNKERVDAGRKLKASLENQLPGGAAGGLGKLWKGTFSRGGGTIPYHLEVRPAGGSRFKGHVEDNVGVAGNWSYDVEGQSSGLGVEFAMSACTRGDFISVRAAGVICGDRLIAEVTQLIRGRKGKPEKGLLVLNRAK